MRGGSIQSILNSKDNKNYILTFKNVTKWYDSSQKQIVALKDISLRVEDGSFTCIVGPSGCGKTTLLTLVAGLQMPSQGSVELNNQVVTKPLGEVGFVFQTDALVEWRRVLGNVMLPIEIKGLKKEDYLDKAMALLNNIGLGDFINHYPKELSGGMRQRASICRAMVHDPPLLLMDEPFGALDAFTRDHLSIELQRIWMQKEKTVLFVTHNIQESVFLGDEVILMSPRPGEIIKKFKIDLPRPRTLRMRETMEFIGYEKDIRETLEAGGYRQFQL